ncbi:FeoB-associated Cys-rich membrane protein [Tenacibaculum jejuense]|uniref:FeoB-associated Cys-rich membrane protein n=1 Tax=Tenacibaculum jejuense TaxID=584609 RepID=UPI000BA3EB69|nr:FeoB-associated Cys-rich membrane protein [Tenacibaculum jejuense]
MAFNSAFWNGNLSLCFCFNNFSSSTMIQEIITYSIVVLAVLFLGRKFIFKSKNNGCDPGCGCS